MTVDSPAGIGHAQLTNAFLWLVGAPLALLDALYLTSIAPPVNAQHPESLVVWVLGIAALALLGWSLLCSACAHLALLRIAPPAARRAARFFVARCGTKLSRSLLARAGASALIGSTLATGVCAAPSLASPQESASTDISLTWADRPSSTPHDHDPTDTMPTTLPSPAQSTAPAQTPSSHDSITVAPGDSLWTIAAALQPGADDALIDATWRAIHAANADSIRDPSLIYPGQTLAIPKDLP